MEKKKGVIIIFTIAILILAGILVGAGSYTIGNHEGYEDGFESGTGYGMAYASSIISWCIYETEIGEFIEEVETKIVYVLEVEPVEIIIHPLMECQEVLYNITYYQLNKEEVENQSAEIWITNKTERTRWMTFSMALPNDQDPFKEEQLYQFYSLQLGYKYYSVIYYTMMHTGDR